MSDIMCIKCGEPWELDVLHGLDGTFDEAWRRFRVDGCEALGTSHNRGQAPPEVALLAELSGDDVDGFAADLEDFGLTW